jgi:flavin reductase (DIM6/NTAB) family NADH-FMN oxidoreductase RutF
MKMHFDTQALDTAAIYKLLTGIVVPRPIAWVMSRNEAGQLNLAPFSFFNCVGTEPGLVILSVGNHPDRPKDTAANVQAHPYFVVNMVDEAHAQAMSDSATDYPSSISEVETLQLTTAPSSLIDVPRLADVPAALECKLHSVQTIGKNRLILGEIVGIYVRDEFIGQSYSYSMKWYSYSYSIRLGRVRVPLALSTSTKTRRFHEGRARDSQKVQLQNFRLGVNES